MILRFSSFILEKYNILYFHARKKPTSIILSFRIIYIYFSKNFHTLWKISNHQKFLHSLQKNSSNFTIDNLTSRWRAWKFHDLSLISQQFEKFLSISPRFHDMFAYRPPSFRLASKYWIIACAGIHSR